MHLRDFVDIPASWQDTALAETWSDIRAARKSVQEAIEPLRASKELGSSLEAHPVLVTSSKHVFAAAGEMADICITSQITVQEGEGSVTVEKAQGTKCERCWKVLPEVAGNSGLCHRCSDAVAQLQKAA